MSTKIYLVILFSMVATQISRLSPMFLSRKFQMSENFERWLKYIPVSVLTAMIIPEFFNKTQSGFEINYFYLISGILAFAVGIWRKNMLLSTAIGVACLAGLRFTSDYLPDFIF